MVATYCDFSITHLIFFMHFVPVVAHYQYTIIMDCIIVAIICWLAKFCISTNLAYSVAGGTPIELLELMF